MISVIIPARNEEASLATCLDSLLTQTGVAFEIIVVDDHSTDRTREIAKAFQNHGVPDASSREMPIRPAVHVIDAGPLPNGWTGKNNAVVTGVREAHGKWLLFTDADTVHLPGSLARALQEAQVHRADMLSYSPEQIAVTFWEMAVLPVVFAELARQYPPSKVSDSNSPIAAANGQYILIKREIYDAVGGHAAIADSILEDVALARAVKFSRYTLRFRYADDAVRTRMYSNFRQLREGWTKNLALLFPDPGRLAVQAGAVWAITWLLFVLAVRSGMGSQCAAFTALFGLTFLRIRRSNFSRAKTFIAAMFGLPMFAYLLLRSKRIHRKGNVSWKGRTYSDKGGLLAASR